MRWLLKRPKTLSGFTKYIDTPNGPLFITINFVTGKPVEVLITTRQTGSDIAAFLEAIARLITVALQYGISIEEVIEQLSGVGGKDSTIDTIAKALEEIS